MILKHLVATGVVWSLLLAPQFSIAQAANPNPPAHPSSTPPAARPAGSSAPSAASVPAASGAGSSGAGDSATSPANCQGPDCDNPQPHITIATPAPAPATWTLPERISWIANLILVIIAYVAIFFALSMLRKIERQSRYAETAAVAATESAKAALLYAQAQARSERPWIVVSAEPAPSAPDSFQIIATNRGHTPARFVTLVDDMLVAPDENSLPPTPAYKGEPQPPRLSIILLPGESAPIKSFSRNEVSSVCESPEQFRLVEDWEAKIYLFGNIVYAELLALEKEIVHETSWCCWYIHGRQKSGMVMAGPREYNVHT
jgi:hypothetical protein